MDKIITGMPLLLKVAHLYSQVFSADNSLNSLKDFLKTVEDLTSDPSNSLDYEVYVLGLYLQEVIDLHMEFEVDTIATGNPFERCNEWDIYPSKLPCGEVKEALDQYAFKSITEEQLLEIAQRDSIPQEWEEYLQYASLAYLAFLKVNLPEDVFE